MHRISKASFKNESKLYSEIILSVEPVAKERRSIKDYGEMMTIDSIAKKAKDLPLEEKLLFVGGLQEFLNTGTCPTLQVIEQRLKNSILLCAEFTLAGVQGGN